MKIVLLRHGPPDFKSHWIKPANGARRALDLYAASRVTTQPPDEISALSSRVDICVSSKLARAIDSAQALGFKDSIASALFNESELPHPKQLYVPLPWILFLFIYRLLWFFGLTLNSPGKTKDRTRAKEASKYLAELAMKNGYVVLVGHGIMNRLISAELEHSGWKIDTILGSGYWSSITLSCAVEI